MNMKRYLKVLPAVAALLLTAACSSSEDIETIEAPQPSKGRIIHFTAKVNNGDATRATLAENYYNFESGDKLYVWGENISGELTMTDYGTTSSQFAGNLTYTGEGDPGQIDLNAVVKGPSDQIIGTLTVFAGNDFKPTYTGLATDKTDAVKKFSYLTTSGSCDFSLDNNPTCYFDYLEQQSAFVSFDITLEDGTAAGVDIPVTVKSGNGDTRTGSVTTVSESGAVKAKFTAAFAGGTTTLSGATIKLGDRAYIDFGGSRTLDANKNYTVTKTYRYKMTISLGGETRERGYGSYPTISLADVISAKAQYKHYVSLISDCEYESGDDIIDVSGTASNLVLTVKGTGTCNMNVIVLNGAMSIPVTFTITDLKPEP